MNRQARTVAIVLLGGLVSLVGAPMSASADGPQAIATVGSGAKPRTPTVLTTKNTATVPGDKKTYEAVLKNKTSEAPIAGKKVTFRIEGKSGTVVPNGGIAVGDGTTDAEGKAHVTFSTPDLAQGAYALKASFAGDHEALGDDVEANLFVAKAATHIEISEPNNIEAGVSQYYVNVSLVRDSDKKGLFSKIALTLNGTPRKLSGSGGYIIPLQPLEATSWKMKVTFDGDDTALASSLERTLTRPKK